MKPCKERKIVIIGLGFLMEYIFPCFREIFGDDVKSRIIGVTADEADLAGKKQRMGIDVMLNDNAAALRTLEPDMIFFAPPPPQARPITGEVLVPYFRELRK
jgi:prephenate dehydrogenase